MRARKKPRRIVFKGHRYGSRTIIKRPKRKKRRRPRQLERDGDDCIHLSNSIWIFRNKRISNHGSVYEGEHRSKLHEARKIVVKLVPYNKHGKIEARILTKLNYHSHVVSLIHSDVTRYGPIDQIYIALDKCHNENLREFITNRKTNGILFDLDQALGIAQQLIVGVEYIHGENIIHKDLKPDNILFSLDQTTVKIADFGLSEEIESPSAQVFRKKQFGTDGYRPAESFKSSIISQKSDIFSLGGIFFFILSNGEHPFGDDSSIWNHNILENIFDLSGLLVSNVKTSQHLIKCMIEPKLNNRPTIWEVSQHPCWTGNEIECDFGCVRVRWDHGVSQTYRMGYEGKYELELAPAYAQARKQMVVGARVVRGPDWRWEDEDGQGEGTVTKPLDYFGYVTVQWDHGVTDVYLMGFRGKYELELAPPDTNQPSTSSAINRNSSNQAISEQRRIMDL